MSNMNVSKLAVIAAIGLMATGGTAAADTPTGVILGGNSTWVQGAGASLYANPSNTLVGIGTSDPNASLHIHSQQDAAIASVANTALRITTDVADGEQILLADSNEILAGKRVVLPGLAPYFIQSRLSLQHEGGELMINGGSNDWTLFSQGSMSTAGPVHIRSGADAAAYGSGGPLVIGPIGQNLAFDGNEIFSRSNGAPSTLHINAEGGSVILHGHANMPAYAQVVFYDDGRVRIGESNGIYAGAARLSVDGLVVAQELRVTPNGWADYVFEPGYALQSTADLERYVRQQQHLPGIPSEQEVMSQGLPVASFSTGLLRNVEELTLRVIEQSKQLSQEQSDHERELAALTNKYDRRLARLEARLEQRLAQ